MDIVDVIQDDHEQIEEYMDQVEATEDEDTEQREAVFKDLRNILEAYTSAEERILYQRLEEEEDVQDAISQAYEDHTVITEQLQSLSEMSMDNSEWIDKFKALREVVERHVEQDEDSILPEAQRLIPDDEREEMADDMRTLEDEIISAGPEMVASTPGRTTLGTNL